MKRTIKAFIFLLIPISVSGQLTPNTDQYILNPMAINPAYAGSRGVLSIGAFYGKQWVGVNGAPSTITLSADAPILDDKIGLGLIVINDKIGVTKENQFITNYAYRLSVGKGVLAFGLGAGLITTNTAWSDLVVQDEGDEYYLIDSKPFVVPHFSFGVFYSNQGYFASFSVPKIFSYKFDLEKSKYQLLNDPDLYNYLFYTGYDFNLSREVKLLPSILLSYTADNKLLFDVNANVSFLERFTAGISYRSNRSFAGLFQMQINNQLRIAYTYDYDIGKLGKYSNGSHDIMIRYEFRYKVEAVNSLIF